MISGEAPVRTVVEGKTYEVMFSSLFHGREQGLVARVRVRVRVRARDGNSTIAAPGSAVCQEVA